jgi:hypothetical protein
VVIGLAQRGWDLSRFVVAGEKFCDVSQAPEELFVAPGSGYDGQFFYRLALDPLTDVATDHGITLDAPGYRQQRIVYPAAAWALSLGRSEWVPSALLALNVAGVAGLGAVGAVLARAVGRHSWWGLAVPLYPGFALSLLHDLSEILAVLLALVGLAMVRRGRPVLATAALVAGVLTRETVLTLCVAGLLAVVLGEHVSRLGRRFGWSFPQSRATPPWVFAVPVVVLVGWQAWLTARWGSVPLLDGAQGLVVPFSGVVRQAWRTVQDPSATGLRMVLEMAVVLVFLVGVVAWGRRTRALGHEVAGFLAYLVLAICLPSYVWPEDIGFLRVLGEPVSLGAIALLAVPGESGRVLVISRAVLWVLAAPSIV